MNDKGKPIKQTPGQKYPDPKLPADDAWSAMEGMLDQQMPSSAKNTFKWAKTIKLISAITLTSGGLIYFLLNNVTGVLENPGNTSVKQTETLAQPHEKNNESVENSHTHKPGADSEFVSPVKTAHRNTINSKTDTTSSTTNQKATKESDINSQNKFPNKAPSKKELARPQDSANLPRTLPSYPAGRSARSKIRYPIASSRPLTHDLAPGFSKRGAVLSTPNTTEDSYRQVTKRGALKNKEDRAGHGVFVNENGQITPSSQNAHTTAKDAQTVNERTTGSFLILNHRKFTTLNNLENKVRNIKFQRQSINKTKQKSVLPKGILKNIHAGLLWNVNVPFAGYDAYFKGADSTSDFYKILLPGLWVGKTFNNGNELIIKARAYNPYFGGKRPFSSVDSLRRYFLPARDTLPARDSVVNYHHSMYLIKSSGFNVGMQYNQRISSRWALGAGANVQFQKSAVVRYSNIVSDSTKTISSIGNFDSVTPKSDSPKYLSTCFITSNVEVLYYWKKLQLGAGVVIPVTSMIAYPYRNLRPVSGQVTVKWWVR